MGFSSDIMHDFVDKEIKAIFSTYDGWKVREKKPGEGYDTLVTLERRTDGHRECVRVLATYERAVTPDMIAALMQPVEGSDGTITRNTFAILVPGNADTAAVPSGVRTYTMRSFAFEGKELIWIKKPYRKTETPKVTA